MATINASISISSDIMNYPVSINKTMTMTKAGSCNGLENTSGLNSKKVQSTTRFLLFSNADATTLKVETANGYRIIDLAADEFCYFPHHAEAAGILQLEASAGTIIAEYGYWTKA